jgi:hypothetical protein
MSIVIFTGCSFTAGNGWVIPPKDTPYANIECKDYPDLWVNLCHQQIDQLKELTLINNSCGGASNTEIFEAAVGALSEHLSNTKYLFVQWTSMPRYNFKIGLELWNTNENLHGGKMNRLTHDVKLSNGTLWNRNYLTDLLDRLMVLHHLHPEIVKVVSYSSIISTLCKQLNINVVFINGLCPWDNDYFVNLCNIVPPGITVFPDDLTKFTQDQIIQVSSRTDKDILILYDQIHSDYESAGSIDPTEWVNLYHSMANDQVDFNHDNLHPGTQSNQLYFQQIKNFLETQ